ncbi:MAG: tetratricopeptide repeat protein [Candidatus Omnitrophica bacterium]|nr:tetratricopeptide repeat protein [Candidatus Omnitrophota bacterium]
MEEEYEERGELDKAIECYKKAVEICPKEIGVYTGVGMAYLLKGDTENARHWLNKALELKPNYATYGHMLISLLNRNNKWQDGKGCTEAIVLFSKFIATDPVARDFLKMVKNTKKYAKEQSTWISLDTENIIQICKNNGIKIILVNYSRDDDPGNAIANSILEKIALEHSIPFVNNYKVFQELFSKGEIKHDYFVRDGHPNAKGYALMARNIYNVIIEQKMFDINKRIKPEYTQLP